MRLRSGWVLVLVVLVAAGGCGKGGYVRTSLGKEHHVEPAVNRIDPARRKRGDSAAALQRDLVEMQRQLAAGDFAAVRQRAGGVLKRHPASVEANTYLAVALDRTGDPVGAGKHYLRAAEAAPGQGGSLGNYAIWLCGQGRTADALRWFDRALALPDYARSPWLLANAGSCASRAGHGERAERELRHAIELDPENAVALAALARRAFDAGNPFQARAFSERRLAAAPADAEALLLASQIEQKLGDSPAAARYVSRLRSEFPDAPEARDSTNGDGGRQ